MGEKVTLEELESELEKVWGQIDALIEAHDALRLGPPGLVSHEIELIRARLEVAREESDADALGRCLVAAQLLLTQLNLLHRYLQVPDEQDGNAPAKNVLDKNAVDKNGPDKKPSEKETPEQEALEKEMR